ncbi:MAG: hypothetical protein FJ000_08520 [Actinobacteria bacterium]|nr:hypothetical protein [Actinomycetota bacterium]
MVWVADRGFASSENRRLLRRGDDAYIMAEKLRGGSAEAQTALACAGRYCELAGGQRIKEVRISGEERFVICHNPQAAVRDAAVRARLVARLEEMIAGSDALSATKRAELRGAAGTRVQRRSSATMRCGGAPMPAGKACWSTT